MKSIISMHGLLFAVFVTLTLLMYSQTGYTHPKDAHNGKVPTQLIEALELSDSQKQVFFEVISLQHEMKESIRVQYKASRDEEKAQMDALHEDTVAQLSSILSPEQLADFEELAKKHRPHRPQFSTINYF